MCDFSSALFYFFFIFIMKSNGSMITLLEEKFVGLLTLSSDVIVIVVFPVEEEYKCFQNIHLSILHIFSCHYIEK